MKRLCAIILLTSLFFTPSGILFGGDTVSAQTVYDSIGWLPDKEDHLVYDYYGLLDSGQIDSLEHRLLAFNDSTSNQIVVMITPGFGGDEISNFAFNVGDKWGIGRKSLSNGLIIVVKPKDDTDGEVEIATGKGLEGALPDLFCKRIIEDEMIPHFQQEDYYGGIVAALDIILPVCAGEYNFDKYKEDHKGHPLRALLIMFGIFALFIWVVYKLDKKTGGTGFSGGSGGSYTGGTTHMSSWGGGGWSGGSSSSGGFGGFGGGSFGGGGARGRW